MFSVFGSAGDVGDARRPSTSRACDQCKSRKVKCDMVQPCVVCSKQGFECTYNAVKKRRGPAGKRIREIHLQQQRLSIGPEGHTVATDSMLPRAYEGSLVGGTSAYEQPAALPLSMRSACNGDAGSDVDQLSAQSPYWAMEGPARDASTLSPVTALPDHIIPDAQSSTRVNLFSGDMSATDIRSSPSLSEVLFPSRPIDSPSHELNSFALISQQDLPALTEPECSWPRNIDEQALLPWIDVYFKRLNPIGPILDMTTIYHGMLMRKHRTDPQYGAMLLAICAFAMSQPIQIHEHASSLSRSVQAHILMGECVKMRTTADFGEHTTIEMVLTSLFLFSCLFNSNKHGAATLRLREALSLAQNLGLHLPESYAVLDAETREQWLRTYLALSVTERAYALQRYCSIGFTGRPGVTARFMQAFDPTTATEYISRFTSSDFSDSVAMTGLLYLMETFDHIGEHVIECWNGKCVFVDGICEYFDRRRALQAFRAQYRAHEACLTGNISCAPSATALPLPKLTEAQQADILITQCWLLNRLWKLCASHGLVHDSSQHDEFCHMFACQVALSVHEQCKRFPLSALEVHGVGLIEKVYDVAMGAITAMEASSCITLDTPLTRPDTDKIFLIRETLDNITVRSLLQDLNRTVQEFRGGDHQYSERFEDALKRLPGYYG